MTSFINNPHQKFELNLLPPFFCSYYFASVYIKNFDKIIGVKKSITIMQMVSWFWITPPIKFTDLKFVSHAWQLKASFLFPEQSFVGSIYANPLQLLSSVSNVVRHRNGFFLLFRAEYSDNFLRVLRVLQKSIFEERQRKIAARSQDREKTLIIELRGKLMRSRPSRPN